VLVVEDDPRNPAMMAEAVDELGYATVARDGMEGLELARRYGPDMILTDAPASWTAGRCAASRRIRRPLESSASS
jgi:CheY-like chemotaxis protein